MNNSPFTLLIILPTNKCIQASAQTTRFFNDLDLFDQILIRIIKTFGFGSIYIIFCPLIPNSLLSFIKKSLSNNVVDMFATKKLFQLLMKGQVEFGEKDLDPDWVEKVWI